MSWNLYDREYYQTPINFNYETGTETGKCIECGSYQPFDEMEEIPDGYVCNYCYYKWTQNQEEEL